MQPKVNNEESRGSEGGSKACSGKVRRATDLGTVFKDNRSQFSHGFASVRGLSSFRQNTLSIKNYSTLFTYCFEAHGNQF